MDDLYFIRAESGPIKIGRAKDPAKRLKAMQTGSHDPLTLEGVLLGRGYEEKVWHHAFADERLKGEWFEESAQLTKAMALAMSGERWWDHLVPPFSWAGWSEDPEWFEDDICDWHIAIHIALAGAIEKIELPTSLAGKNFCVQDNARLNEESAA